MCMENILEKYNARADDYAAGRPTYAGAFVRSLFCLSEILTMGNHTVIYRGILPVTEGI